MTQPKINQDILIKIKETSGEFKTVAGMRAKRFWVHDDGSTDFNGDAVMRDYDAEELLRTIFFSGSLREYLIVVPGCGQHQGKFQITSIEYRGKRNGEPVYEFRFNSEGVVTFTESEAA